MQLNDINSKEKQQAARRLITLQINEICLEKMRISVPPKGQLVVISLSVNSAPTVHNFRQSGPMCL